MPEQNQCCGTCLWFSPSLHEAECEWPENNQDKIVFWADRTGVVYAHEGTDCPCWQERKDGE